MPAECRVLTKSSLLRRVSSDAQRSGFWSENFENLLRPQNFAVGIARDRAKIHTDLRRPASPRLAEVYSHIAERQHGAAREI